MGKIESSQIILVDIQIDPGLHKYIVETETYPQHPYCMEAEMHWNNILLQGEGAIRRYGVVQIHVPLAECTTTHNSWVLRGLHTSQTVLVKTGDRLIKSGLTLYHDKLWIVSRLIHYTHFPFTSGRLKKYRPPVISHPFAEVFAILVRPTELELVEYYNELLELAPQYI